MNLPWIPISDNATLTTLVDVSAPRDTRTSRCLDVVVTCTVPHAVVYELPLVLK